MVSSPPHGTFPVRETPLAGSWGVATEMLTGGSAEEPAAREALSASEPVGTLVPLFLGQASPGGQPAEGYEAPQSTRDLQRAWGGQACSSLAPFPGWEERGAPRSCSTRGPCAVPASRGFLHELRLSARRLRSTKCCAEVDPEVESGRPRPLSDAGTRAECLCLAGHRHAGVCNAGSCQPLPVPAFGGPRVTKLRGETFRLLTANFYFFLL